MAQIATITNPLTGQPAQVDQLDHTAQQIDDGLNIARGVSNPNLLDNWYFGNPVDQRQGRIVKPNTTYYSDNTLTTSAGTTSAYVTAYRYATGTANGVNYASFKLTDSDTAPTYYAAPENVVRGYTGAGYGPDRWFLSNADGSMFVEDTGVRLTVTNTCNFTQSLPLSLAGETVTLSALAEDVSGPAYLSIRADNFGWMEDGGRVAIQNGLTTLTFTVASSRTANKKVCISNIDDTSQVSVKIKAAKLELGTQQTLAHQDENGNWVLNEIPDYGEQLARCQRQAEKSCNMGTSVGSPETASPIIKVAYSKWGFCEPMVFFKVPKRAIPAVKIFSAKTGAEGMAYDETAMQDVAVTPSYIGQNSFTVQHASENLVTGHAYQFYYFATAEL